MTGAERRQPNLLKSGAPLRILAKGSLLLLFCWPLTAFQSGKGELYFRTANQLQAEGRGDLALSYLGRALQADPGHSGAYLSRAFVRLERKEFAGALSDLGRVIELKPEEPAGYLARGLALSQSGKGAAAADDFRKGCQLGDQSACEFLKESTQ
jgi:regulator of sirC expression with transglutaminase-like and TPR domain